MPDELKRLELEEMLEWWCDLLEDREPQMRELEDQDYIWR